MAWFLLPPCRASGCFFAGFFLWWLYQRTKKPLALAIMTLLAVINSQCFIIPLSEQTSMPAFQAGQTGLVRRHLWLPKRGKPVGAVNGSWLPGCLAVYSLWREKAKPH
jgi:membrane-associated phospholipid phosphatase